MIAVYQIDSRTLTKGIIGWDTEQGRVYADATCLPTVDSIKVLVDYAPAAYIRVATVDALSLDDVYMHTQHVTQHWFDNPRITVGEVAARERVRSTSMGDVLVKGGVGYLVTQHGFEELPQELVARIETGAV